ncbi:MAG: hypothetical protein U1E73_03075 [Planctomycetota bacterium]
MRKETAENLMNCAVRAEAFATIERLLATEQHLEMRRYLEAGVQFAKRGEQCR